MNDLTEFLAMRFMVMNRTYTLRTVGTIQDIYIYSNGIYINKGQTYIKEFCDKMLGKWYSDTLAQKIIDKIVVRTYIDAEELSSKQISTKR